MKTIRVRSMPTQPATAATRIPRLHHRALLDVELEVEPRRSRREPASSTGSRSTPFSASTSGALTAVGVGGGRRTRRVERPGDRRAAEQAAPEAGALLVGPVDERDRCAAAGSPASAQARRTPSPAITPRAPSSQPPSGTESRCEPSATAGSVTALEVRPEVAGLVALRLEADLAEQLGEEAPRGAPLLAPAEPPRAAGTAGAAVELAQVGDHPGRVDRRRPIAALCPSEPLAAQGLAEAVGAAAAEGEHLQVGVEDLGRAPPRLVEPVARPREHAVAAEGDGVDAELEASPLGTSISSKPISRASGPAPPRAPPCRPRRAFGARTAISTSMWTNWPGDRLDPGLPAVLLEPASELAGGGAPGCGSRRCRSRRGPARRSSRRRPRARRP